MNMLVFALAWIAVWFVGSAVIRYIKYRGDTDDNIPEVDFRFIYVQDDENKKEVILQIGNKAKVKMSYQEWIMYVAQVELWSANKIKTWGGFTYGPNGEAEGSNSDDQLTLKGKKTWQL